MVFVRHNDGAMFELLLIPPYKDTMRTHGGGWLDPIKEPREAGVPPLIDRHTCERPTPRGGGSGKTGGSRERVRYIYATYTILKPQSSKQFNRKKQLVRISISKILLLSKML